MHHPPLLTAIIALALMPPLIGAENVDASPERHLKTAEQARVSHRSRSVNATVFGLTPGSTANQSTSRAEAVTYASQRPR